MLNALTGSNDLQTSRYFPHVHEFSDFILSACGRRNYELVARHAGLDSITSALKRRPSLQLGIMSNVFAHFIEQAAVMSSAVYGKPAPIVFLDGGQLEVIRLCLSMDGVALTPGLGYIPSFGHLGLTKLGLTELNAGSGVCQDQHHVTSSVTRLLQKDWNYCAEWHGYNVSAV